MNLEFVAPVVAASLMGSLHCALMCGGLVAILPRKPGLTPLFHLGRLAAYAALGMAAGSAGSVLDLAGARAGLGRIAALVCGALVLLFGLTALLASQGVRLPGTSLGAGFTQRLAGFALRVERPVQQALLLGVSTAFLPCGWLYAFVLSAAGTASPLAGGAVMVAFFAGTLPSLLGVGFLLPRLVAPLGRHLPVLSALLLVGLGLFSIVHRANLPEEAFSVLTARAETGEPPTPATSPKCH